MPSKVFISGILAVVLICILVFSVEFFIPLSEKADMNALCRNTMLKMEAEGGLSQEEKVRLESELKNRGLEEVKVSGTAAAGKGGRLSLEVDADFRYNTLQSLFVRTDTVQHMDYDRVSMSRRVVN